MFNCSDNIEEAQGLSLRVVNHVNKQEMTKQSEHFKFGINIFNLNTSMLQRIFCGHGMS